MEEFENSGPNPESEREIEAFISSGKIPESLTPGNVGSVGSIRLPFDPSSFMPKATPPQDLDLHASVYGSRTENRAPSIPKRGPGSHKSFSAPSSPIDECLEDSSEPSEFSGSEAGRDESQAVPKPTPAYNIKRPLSSEGLRPASAHKIKFMGDENASAVSNRNTFSQAYVERLQERHQERLTEHIKQSQAALAEKNKVIQELRRSLDSQQKEFAERENEVISVWKQAKTEANSAAEEASAQTQSVRKDMAVRIQSLRDTHQETIQQMQEHHAEELVKLREEYASEFERLKGHNNLTLTQVRDWCRDQMRQIETNREYIIEQMKKSQAQQDMENAAKVMQLDKCHDEEMNEMRKLLGQESERLADCRDEVTRITSEMNNSVVALGTKLSETERLLELEQKESAKKILRLAADRDGVIDQLRNRLKHQESLAANELGRQRSRVKILEAQMSDLRQGHTTKLELMTHDIQRLNESLVASKALTETKDNDHAEARRQVKQLLQQNSIYRSEINLLTSELERVRESNISLAGEVNRSGRRVGIYSVRKKKVRKPKELESKE